MRTLRRFWSALDALPGAATDAHEWRERLGDEWSSASSYLRRNGRLALSVNCPMPGGEDCPRRVVALPDGRLRGVCASVPALCDPIELRPLDVAILEVDRAKLGAALANALDAGHGDSPVRVPGSCVVVVGRHAVAAGVSCPVVLALHGPDEGRLAGDLRRAGLDGEQGVILVPTARSLSPSAAAPLRDRGHQLLVLSDSVFADEAGRLVAREAPVFLLAAARAHLAERIEMQASRVAWHLPPGAGWSELTFRLTADESLTCTFRGTKRTLEPVDLGMRDMRSGKANQSWLALKALAIGRGRAPISDTSQQGKVQKRFQTLGWAIAEAFGIDHSPISWDTGECCYRAAFVISDERPKAARRNFVRYP